MGTPSEKSFSAWQRLTGPWREFGAVAGTLYIADRLLRMLSPSVGLYVYELMAQPIAGKPLLPATMAKNVEVVELFAGDPEIDEMPARAEIKALRFEQGARCLGVRMKNRLVGYLWLAQTSYREDEVRCDYLLQPVASSVFDFDLVVQPAYRNGIGFAAVWHGADAWLHQRGVRRSFSRLTRFNLASRRAHAHLGWSRVGRALFLKAWRIEAMLADIAPFVSLTWRDDQRARLRLVDPSADAEPVAMPSHDVGDTLASEGVRPDGRRSS